MRFPPQSAIRNQNRRAGITLMEVVVSLAIFLVSMAGIGALINMATERAGETRQRALAMQMCQSKMAEFISGAAPIETQSDVTFEHDPNWTWSASCEAETQGIPNLWAVEVKVQRKLGNHTVEAVLTQMMLDPSVRGSTDGMVVTPPVAAKSAGKTGGG